MSIAESIEKLHTDGRAAEARYAALVRDTAAGKTPSEEALAVLAMLGRSLDQFKLDCEDVAANAADGRSFVAARDAQAGVLRDAQQEASRVGAELETLYKILQAVGVAINQSTSAEVGMVRGRRDDLFSQVSVLQAFPNRRMLQGRRSQVANMEIEVANMRKCLGERDNKDFRGRQIEIDYEANRLAELRAAPLQFKTTIDVPPALEPVDMLSVALDATVNTLRSTIPADRQADVFGKLAAAFSTAAKESDKTKTS